MSFGCFFPPVSLNIAPTATAAAARGGICGVGRPCPIGKNSCGARHGAQILKSLCRSAYHGAGNRLAPAVHFSKTKNRLSQIRDLRFALNRRDFLKASGRRASPASPLRAESPRLRRVEQRAEIVSIRTSQSQPPTKAPLKSRSRRTNRSGRWVVSAFGWRLFKSA